MKASTIPILLVLSILSFSSCQTEDPSNSQQSFHIGVLAPKTSFMSGHGESIEMGARVAAAVLNKRGGILGKNVELHVVDSKSDPAVTAQRAAELIGRHRVSLLIGTGTSASTLAAIPHAVSAKVPFIYALDGELKTCRSKAKNEVSRHIWGSGFTERMIVEPYLRYLHSKFSKSGQEFRIYLTGGDYVYPRETNAFARKVAKQFGYTIIGDEYTDTSTTDYAPLIRRILAARPDLLIVTNPGESGVRFMRQAIRHKLPSKMAVGGFATFDQEAVEAMGQASENVYTVNRYSNRLAFPANKQFLAEFRARYPEKDLLPGPTAAAGAYGVLLTAAQAFKKANSHNAKAFYRAMRGLEIDLPQGRIRVNPINNIFDQPIYIMQIRNQRYEIAAEIDRQAHPELQACSVS